MSARGLGVSVLGYLGIWYWASGSGHFDGHLQARAQPPLFWPGVSSNRRAPGAFAASCCLLESAGGAEPGPRLLGLALMGGGRRDKAFSSKPAFTHPLPPPSSASRRRLAGIGLGIGLGFSIVTTYLLRWLRWAGATGICFWVSATGICFWVSVPGHHREDIFKRGPAACGVNARTQGARGSSPGSPQCWSTSWPRQAPAGAPARTAMHCKMELRRAAIVPAGAAQQLYLYCTARGALIHCTATVLVLHLDLYSHAEVRNPPNQLLG